MTKSLHIQNLRKTFNSQEDGVINDIDLSIAQESITAIIGKSGCGKTTLSRLIAGLETPDSGSIVLDGQVLVDSKTFLPPERRGVAFVFQDYALFPHITVQKNVAFGISKKERKDALVDEALQLVGLGKYKDRFPHQLSGGQQQRVALARALASKPKLLILDEPFSNLDTALKTQLRNEIFDILKKTGVTTLFVTHDTQDAMGIADNIVVLKKGRLVQLGSAEMLFNEPKTEYVAELFGNIVSLAKEDLECFGYTAEEGKRYAIRTHQFELNTTATYTTKATIERSVYLGTHYVNTCSLSNNKTLFFNSEASQEGSVTIGFNVPSLLIFDDSDI